MRRSTHSRAVFSRMVFVSVLAVAVISAAARPAGNFSKDHRQFAALSARLSEPGGYFDSDNLISNETSYLHVLGKLRSSEYRGASI